MKKNALGQMENHIFTKKTTQKRNNIFAQNVGELLHDLYTTFTQPIFTQPIFTQPNVKKPYTREDGKQMQQYIFKNCRTHFTEDCILCNEKGCAVRNGAPYTRDDGKRMQQFRCKRCQKTFTRPINKNAEEQAGIETQPN